MDVDITIPVPKGTKARELTVEIKKTRLKAGYKGKEPIMEVSGGSYCVQEVWLTIGLFRGNFARLSMSTSARGS